LSYFPPGVKEKAKIDGDGSQTMQQNENSPQRGKNKKEKQKEKKKNLTQNRTVCTVQQGNRELQPEVPDSPLR
jgi:hypothetical protein